MSRKWCVASRECECDASNKTLQNATRRHEVGALREREEMRHIPSEGPVRFSLSSSCRIVLSAASPSRAPQPSSRWTPRQRRQHGLGSLISMGTLPIRAKDLLAAKKLVIAIKRTARGILPRACSKLRRRARSSRPRGQETVRSTRFP